MTGLARYSDSTDAESAAPAAAGRADESHTTLRVLCGHLDRIALGRGAQVLRDHLDQNPGPAAMVLWGAPAFGWAHPAIDAGRKTADASGTGGRLRLPVRLEWEQEPGSAWAHSGPGLMLLDATDRQEVRLSWSTRSMGHRIHGVVRGHIDPAAFETEVTWSSLGTPLAVRLPVLTEAEVRSHLGDLIADGDLAWWELQDSLRPMVEVILHRAHRWLGHEINNHLSTTSPSATTVDEDNWHVFDLIKMAELTSSFCIGEQGRAGKVANAIERLLDPATMHRVDPLRYLNINLARDAKDHLRAATGDPFLGWRVRRMQEAERFTDAEALMAAYNEAYPTRRAGLQMILDSLMFGRHASAAQAPLYDGDGSAGGASRNTEGSGDSSVRSIEITGSDYPDYGTDYPALYRGDYGVKGNDAGRHGGLDEFPGQSSHVEVGDL